MMGHLKQHFPVPLSPAATPLSHASPAAHDDFLLSMTPPDPSDLALSAAKVTSGAVSTAIQVISTERAALAHLEQIYQTDALAQEHLVRAVSQIVRTIHHGGKLVCCGVGKSGKIAQKLEATMNSLGIYSAFLHPTEALHGDLGMIRPHDTLLLISFSGRTPELLLLLPHIPSTVPVIAITSHMHPSTCPLLSFHPSNMGILLPAPIHEDEESSIGVSAPTSSTTVALSLGDALAIATARRLHTTPGRGPAEIFKSYHPGGAIGAASMALTPMSMSSASSTSTPSDYMPTQQSIASFPQTDSKGSQRPRVADMLTSLDQIPKVSASGKIRLLDILLTAIQHPHAKSWVFLSPSEIIPPRHLRFLSQSNYVDMHVSSFVDLGLPFSVSRKDWLQIPSSSTIDDARRLASEANASASTPVVVIALMHDDECLGVIEAEDLWNDCDD
ncbi:SIS domain-containing protein [Aspergillus homomorphus CBS 101889]|uniref:SIS domain-containing protein n=1 Tax=Aspergillus homomorphus (strain CBS 101889) TaxID=1450537 RepID=A0A395IAN9_ASPHC|nr:SIS domain-containing protein [Aspergillus homomorphus CBS 101889]RAL17330.1 SIS domain-containing protein [Aspergillus homomorphus CBS 101889]